MSSRFRPLRSIYPLIQTRNVTYTPRTYTRTPSKATATTAATTATTPGQSKATEEHAGTSAADLSAPPPSNPRISEAPWSGQTLPDAPSNGITDWNSSFHGLSSTPFSREASEILLAPIDLNDIEIKPDGLLYLPEIKYRRILNRAFGPGGWGLAPRSEADVGARIVSREYALICLGRLVSVAKGEQEYFDPSGVATATEAAKSNALMRCCKDLGIASELWDPSFIRKFKKSHCTEVWTEHVVSKKKQKRWRRLDSAFDYPYKEG